MSDLISRESAIVRISSLVQNDWLNYEIIKEELKDLPSVEIIRCKDCKFYTPMNCETRTGICRLLMHQNFGDDWYCAGAERRNRGEEE